MEVDTGFAETHSLSNNKSFSFGFTQQRLSVQFILLYFNSWVI